MSEESEVIYVADLARIFGRTEASVRAASYQAVDDALEGYADDLKAGLISRVKTR